MPSPFPCPKCGRSLIPTGELEVVGIALPVYQCDECLTIAKAMGIEAEVALTFVVKDCRAMNPVAPDEPLALD